MTVADMSKASIRNYVRELRFIFEYYPDTLPSQISAEQIEQYICYIKKVFNSGYSKCRQVAAAVSFFFKQVLRKPYALPSKLYPRKGFKLPNVMSQDEVWHLLGAAASLKQKAMLELFYSSGVRLEEFSHLRLTDIDSGAMRIKVVQGKGKKDRYTLLSQRALLTLREYYREHRPTTFLFEGKTAGKGMHNRSIQHAIGLCYKKAGLSPKQFNVHTLRHTFATHLLDSGCDLHTIKELLGHAKIETTMIYLHLQTHRCSRILNPLDHLHTQEQSNASGAKQ